MSLAVLCPGQGAQHPAMLDLVAGHAGAQRVLAEGSQAIGDDVRTRLAQPQEIHANRVAQPLICLTELATWTALRDELPEPVAIAGYSVGELASYGVAGALDAASLARLAQTRAAAMDAANAQPSSLLALRGLARAEVDVLCKDSGASIAIVNGDDAFVTGGTTPALEALSTAAAARGARVTAIRICVASHTPLLASAVAPWRAALEASTLRAPPVPVVAGIDAAWVASRDRAIETLAVQVATPIVWARCLDTLHERGCRVFLELGPGAALTAMVRDRLGGDVEARSVSDFRSLAGVAAWVGRMCG